MENQTGKLCVCGSFCLKEAYKIEVFVKSEKKTEDLFNFYIEGWDGEVGARMKEAFNSYNNMIFFETHDMVNFIGKTKKGLVLFYNLSLDDQKNLLMLLS